MPPPERSSSTRFSPEGSDGVRHRCRLVERRQRARVVEMREHLDDGRVELGACRLAQAPHRFARTSASR